MREYICLPWEKIIPVGDRISVRDAALIEPMSVGFHAVARGQVFDIDTVLVFGCGMVGLGAIIRCAQRGARVIATDISAEKLELARNAGATFTINSREEDLIAKVNEYTDGMGADVVIEAVGSPATYVSAIDAVCFTGRVVCTGYSKSDVSFQTKFFVQKELDIRGSRNAMPDDFRAVIRYMAAAPDSRKGACNGQVRHLPERNTECGKEPDCISSRPYHIISRKRTSSRTARRTLSLFPSAQALGSICFKRAFTLDRSCLQQQEWKKTDGRTVRREMRCGRCGVCGSEGID